MGFSLTVPHVKSHQHSGAVGDGGTLTEATQLNSASLLSLILVMG
jgi:hypothetical protein